MFVDWWWFVLAFFVADWYQARRYRAGYREAAEMYSKAMITNNQVIAALAQLRSAVDRISPPADNLDTEVDAPDLGSPENNESLRRWHQLPVLESSK